MEPCINQSIYFSSAMDRYFKPNAKAFGYNHKPNAKAFGYSHG